MGWMGFLPRARQVADAGGWVYGAAMRLRSVLAKILPGCLSAALFSCASDYHRDFRAAVKDQPDPPVDPTGPWQGEWRSQANGHHGPLWCMIERADDAHHDFRYRAGWGAVQFGDYTHRAATKVDGETLEFSGDMELPGEFGTYKVEGEVSAERFDASFESDTGDRGTMTLRRP